MVLDTSAVLAILLREPEANSLRARLARGEALFIGTPSVLEAMMVVTSRTGADSSVAITEFLRKLGVEYIPFTADHAKVAHDAFRNYGKGNHPAKLNLGDCMTYAIAKVANQPLLFVGNDFSLTDLEIA